MRVVDYIHIAVVSPALGRALARRFFAKSWAFLLLLVKCNTTQCCDNAFVERCPRMGPNPM